MNTNRTIEQDDVRRRHDFLNLTNKTLDEYRVKFRAAKSDSERQSVAQAGYSLRDQRSKHLGAPLDLAATSTCSVCKRFHVRLLS